MVAGLGRMPLDDAARRLIEVVRRVMTLLTEAMHRPLGACSGDWLDDEPKGSAQASEIFYDLIWIYVVPRFLHFGAYLYFFLLFNAILSPYHCSAYLNYLPMIKLDNAIDSFHCSCSMRDTYHCASPTL